MSGGFFGKGGFCPGGFCLGVYVQGFFVLIPLLPVPPDNFGNPSQSQSVPSQDTVFPTECKAILDTLH